MSRGREGVEVEGAFDGDRGAGVLILHRQGRGGFLVADGHFGLDAAAHREVADDRHAPRLTGGDKIVENLIRHVFVENALVAELDKVVFEGLQFDAQPIGHIGDANLTEIGQSGFRTDGCELGAADGDFVVAIRLWIGKRFEGRA